MTGLIVAFNFKPAPGGVAEFSHQVAVSLTDLGERIAVLAPPMEGDTDSDRYARYEIYRRIKNRMDFSDIIVELAKHIRADYLICNRWKPSLGTNVMAAARQLDIPFFLLAQGTEVTRVLNAAETHMREAAFRVARKTYAVSRFTREQVRQLGVDQTRIEILPCGVSLDVVDNWLERKESLNFHDQEIKSVGGKTILTLARLVERKGIDKIIEAIALLRKSFSDINYVVAGEGPYRDRLEELATIHGVGDIVEFRGHVSEEEKFSCFHSCDVFAMPSRMVGNGDVEGFGMVFLEANAFRKPVIGGNSGGIEDAIVHGETGLLVDPTDSEAIAEAIAALLFNDTYRLILGEKGRKRVEQSYTWPQIARSLRDSISASDKAWS